MRLVRFLPLLLAALVLAPVRADDEEPDKDELDKVQTPLKKAMAAALDKKYDDAEARFDEFFAALGKAKLPAAMKKEMERDTRYFYAGVLAQGEKKDKAIEQFKKSIELENWDWKQIDDDKDLDSIRDEPAFKDAIAAGKVAQKAQLEKETKEAVQETKKALEGKAAFELDFEVKCLDGKTLKLSDLKGKVVVVDVWGTWCGPCRAEIPHFVKLYETYAEKGLEIVGLASEATDEDEPAQVVKKFAEENKIKYPLSLVDESSPILKAIPKFSAYPTTVFIDRSGAVRMKKVGYHDYEPLEAIVKTLLEAAGDKK